MSQSNNRRLKKRITHKDRFILNTVVMTITICLIFIIITILAVNNKPNNVKEEKNDEVKQVSQLVNDGILPVKLTDKYKQNDLKTYERTYESNYYTTIDENGNTNETAKLEMRYSQIDGLIDKNLENTINEEIKNTSTSMYTEQILEDQNIQKVVINARVTANYADVLSVQIERAIEYKDNNGYDLNYKYLNYELKTGKKIEFKNLFTYNTAIKPIIANSAYEYFAWTYDNNEEDGLDNDMNQVDYSDIENKVNNVLKMYNNSNEINFGFDEKYIYLTLGNITINIDMSKYSDNIAIYNRYKTYDKIYDYENVGLKNIFVFSMRPNNSYYSLIEDEQNYYIDVAIYTEDNIDSKFLEKQKQNLQLKVSEIRNMAKSNTNNAILYAGYIYIGRSTSDNTIYVSTDLGRYVTSYTYYKSTFYDEIGNQARQNHVDMSYYIDFDKNYVEYTAETEQLQYDAETYEEIKQNSEETNETQENGNIEQENQETNTIQSQVEENNENIINENVVNENVIVNSQNTNITLNNA